MRWWKREREREREKGSRATEVDRRGRRVRRVKERGHWGSSCGERLESSLRMRERLGTIAYAHCKQRFRARSRVPAQLYGQRWLAMVMMMRAVLRRWQRRWHRPIATMAQREHTATDPSQLRSKTHPWVSCTHSFTERRDGPLTEHDAPKLVVDADRRHPRSLERLLRISQQKTRLPNRTVPEQNDLHALVEILLGHEVQSDVRTLHNTYT